MVSALHDSAVNSSLLLGLGLEIIHFKWHVLCDCHNTAVPGGLQLNGDGLARGANHGS